MFEKGLKNTLFALFLGSPELSARKVHLSFRTVIQSCYFQMLKPNLLVCTGFETMCIQEVAISKITKYAPGLYRCSTGELHQR